MSWERTRNKNCNFNSWCQITFQSGIQKSYSGPPCVHPAAPMVLQGAPEVPKWFSWVAKWKHQILEMATARSYKGSAVEGVAIEIQQTPSRYVLKQPHREQKPNAAPLKTMKTTMLQSPPQNDSRHGPEVAST